MRILYISQYFPPEVGATQTRAYEMASYLVNAGHQVTMLTEVPNHPTGIIKPEFKGKLFHRAVINGIDVVRIWVKASPKKNFTNRMIFYVSFMVNAILAGLLITRKQYDLIYATSPPLFVGFSAACLSFFKGTPYLFEVRDLWPESAVALNQLSNPRSVHWAEKLEMLCYKRAKKIIVVTRGIFENLVNRGIAKKKLTLITNGANVDLFQFQPNARLKIRQNCNLENKFITIYAGIFGIAQGLDVVIDVAEILKQDPEFHFLLVGSGPMKQTISNLIVSHRLENITLVPEQPRENIPAYLSAADIAWIPLRKIELFKGALPSKMFDAWACERPLLSNIDGEARELLSQVRGGIFTPPEDPESMVKALVNMKENRSQRHEMGVNGRKFTERYYSRDALAAKLEKILLETLAQSN